MENRGNNVIHVIPPTSILFMNMRLRSFFSKETRLYNATTKLHFEANISYVGDITRISRRDLAKKLGPYYRKYLKEIENELAQVGIFLEARAPWWERPCDYYD